MTRERMRRPHPAPAGLFAAALAAPWVLWAALRALGLERGHPLVAIVAFTPYLAALSPLPVVVALVLRRRATAAVAALAAAALLAGIAPRMLDGPQHADADAGRSGTSLTVMSANLRFGHGDAATVLRLVRAHDVDVLGLQELTPDALRRLDAAGLRTLLPRRSVRPDADWSGLGLMARVSLRAVPTRGPRRQTRLEARLSPAGGGALRVVAVHPLPPISPANTRAWREALRALPGPHADGAGAAARVPRVLLGDFNATLDHRELRHLLGRGYVDAADATGDGLRPTWPTTGRKPPLTIDHVLFPAPVEVRTLSLHDLPGSDHRAIIAELVLPRSSRREREPAP